MKLNQNSSLGGFGQAAFLQKHQLKMRIYSIHKDVISDLINIMRAIKKIKLSN